MSTIEDLKNRIRKHADSSEFADRLIEITGKIESEFEGSERDQLLEVVHETLQRHVEIRENTHQAQEALQQLHAKQAALSQLFEFITARPDRETLH